MTAPVVEGGVPKPRRPEQFMPRAAPLKYFRSSCTMEPVTSDNYFYFLLHQYTKGRESKRLSSNRTNVKGIRIAGRTWPAGEAVVFIFRFGFHREWVKGNGDVPPACRLVGWPVATNLVTTIHPPLFSSPLCSSPLPSPPLLLSSPLPSPPRLFRHGYKTRVVRIESS